MLGRLLNLSGLIVMVQVVRENVPELAPEWLIAYFDSGAPMSFNIVLTFVMRCFARSSSGLSLLAWSLQNASASVANSDTSFALRSPAARARTRGRPAAVFGDPGRRACMARATARLPAAVCSASTVAAGDGWTTAAGAFAAASCIGCSCDKR